MPIVIESHPKSFSIIQGIHFMADVLAFDWGTEIVGVLDINADIYRPYRTRDERIEGAKRIFDCDGIIVSFNGLGRDLLELSKLLALPSDSTLILRGEHHDMMPIVSAIRWPPNPGTAPITGPNLYDTYRHYFGDGLPAPPHLTDPYEISNWLDCKMTAALWLRWRRGELSR
jgi:hypothetical protein